MKCYAKIEHLEKHIVSIGRGSNSSYYESIGMELMDVEQCYDGNWYVVGYAPLKPKRLIEKELQAQYTNYIQNILDAEAQKLRL